MRSSTVRGGDPLRFILTVVPISGTDAGTVSEITSLVSRATVPAFENGTISETALVTVKTTAADTNGAFSEAVVEAVSATVSESSTISEIVSSLKLTVADVNSTLAEAVTLVAPLSATDANGATTETANYKFAQTTADAGTSSEIISALKLVVPADTGTILEAASTGIFKAGTEAGTGADSSSLVAKLTATDANGITETAAPVVRPTVTDGNGISEVVTEVVALVTSDTATAADSASAVLSALQVGSADSGISSDAAVLAAKSTQPDTGGISESTQVALPATDAGTAAEVISQRKLVTTDSGAGTDVGATNTTTFKSGTDAATATESATVAVPVMVSDSGAIAEAAAEISSIPGIELGTISEAAALQQANLVVSQDVAGASESLSKAQGVPEVGSGAENASEAVTVAPTDMFTAVEYVDLAQHYQKSASDASTTVELAVVYVVSKPVELGHANELATLTARISDQDHGTMKDTYHIGGLTAGKIRYLSAVDGIDRPILTGVLGSQA